MCIRDSVLDGCRPHHLVTSAIHPLEIIVRTINIKDVYKRQVQLHQDTIRYLPLPVGSDEGFEVQQAVDSFNQTVAACLLYTSDVYKRQDGHGDAVPTVVGGHEGTAASRCV